ncbi:MAG: 1-phosphofructokinase [Clostridia bacterium]|nr:1-phosphofructokinase [Clostridia bacterium]
MIYTVTFNPALDYVVRIEDMKAGMVNRCADEYILFGGKGINVSIVLHNLGIENRALGFVAGFTGEAIENGVRNMGVVTDFIHLDKGLSRINVKIKSKEETDINAKGPDISREALDMLYSKIDCIQDGDTLVLAGAVPDTLPSDVYEQIMERLKQKKINVVVDATKELLLNVLKYHPFLIKPNNYELGEMFNTVCKNETDIIKYAKELQLQGACNVLVSMAGDGAILIAEDGGIHKIGVPKGTVVNSVGAGDSMVAGFLAGYISEHNYEKALKLGTAAGSATAFSQGLAERTLVEELLKQLG